jgi:hypothetical protein
MTEDSFGTELNAVDEAALVGDSFMEMSLQQGKTK